MDQVQEWLIDEDKFCQHMMNIPNQVVMQIQQDIQGGQVDWVNYQGGIGTQYNLIIVEDDWFGESTC